MKAKMGGGGDFALGYVLAHEVGHQIQHLLGIDREVRRLQGQGSKQEANQLSVLMELQADCYAGVWGTAMERDPLYVKLEAWADGVDWSQFTLPREILIPRLAGFIREQLDYLLSIGHNPDVALKRVLHGPDKGMTILRALDCTTSGRSKGQKVCFTK